MRAVIDTNVLVSGLLSPFGPPGTIVRMIASGAIQPVVDARIIVEYRDVCARPRFGFDAEALVTVLDFIEHAAFVVAPAPLGALLPDPDDAPFLEAAIAARCPLVTGNSAHFPARARQGVDVLTPADWLRLLGESPGH